MNKITVDPIVIVEGKYDKITISNVIDATIIPCGGFEIFKNEEQKRAIRAMALDRGAIILTDSDRAGAVIRSHLNRVLQGCEVYTLYVPAVEGKERRKTAFSKEGLLGVEGMGSDVLRQIFEGFRAEPVKTEIMAHHLFEFGLTGQAGSKEKKVKLLKRLELPLHISNNAFLKELNRRFSLDEFKEYLEQ